MKYMFDDLICEHCGSKNDVTCRYGHGNYGDLCESCWDKLDSIVKKAVDDFLSNEVSPQQGSML